MIVLVSQQVDPFSFKLPTRCRVSFQNPCMDLQPAALPPRLAEVTDVAFSSEPLLAQRLLDAIRSHNMPLLSLWFWKQARRSSSENQSPPPKSPMTSQPLEEPLTRIVHTQVASSDWPAAVQLTARYWRSPQPIQPLTTKSS